MRRRVSLSVCRQSGKNRRAHTVSRLPNAEYRPDRSGGDCRRLPTHAARESSTVRSRTVQSSHRHHRILRDTGSASCESPPAIVSAAAATAPARGEMVVARKRRNCAFREPAEDPDRSVLTRPSHTHRYLMYYLDEKGIRVYTLKVRARFPTRPGRSEPESPADWRKKPSRNVTPRLTEPPLVLAARVDPRKPHPTAAPRSRRTPRGLAPTISSPSSAWRARSASGCCRPRNPFPSFETRETASMISLSTTVRVMRRGARGRSRRETPSVHHP